MKIKELMKNVGFWVSLVSAVFLILGAFGVEIGDDVSSTIINALSSLLVILGVASDPTTGTGYLDPKRPSESASETVTIANDGTANPDAENKSE